MDRMRQTMTWLGVGLVLPLVSARAEDPPKVTGPAPFAIEMNKKFTDPNADVQHFVGRFESDSRDIYVKRREIARAVGLRPGDVVADIGAGTGLFSLLFAEQVGPKGAVYAVDIGPAFVKYIGDRAKQQGCEAIVKPVLDTQDSAALASDSIDVAFVCDTYHHFEHPEKMLASIGNASARGAVWWSSISTFARTAASTSSCGPALRRRSIAGKSPRPVSIWWKRKTPPCSPTSSTTSFAASETSRRPAGIRLNRR